MSSNDDDVVMMNSPLVNDNQVLTVYVVGDNTENRQCLIYDPDVLYTLHTKYRLVAKMIGSLPFHTSQNLYHSVPALLSPDQVTLALRRGWITIQYQNNDSVMINDGEEE